MRTYTLLALSCLAILACSDGPVAPREAPHDVRATEIFPGESCDTCGYGGGPGSATRTEFPQNGPAQPFVSLTEYSNGGFRASESSAGTRDIPSTEVDTNGIPEVVALNDDYQSIIVPSSAALYSPDPVTVTASGQGSGPNGTFTQAEFCSNTQYHFNEALKAYNGGWAKFWKGVISYDFWGDKAEGADEMEAAFDVMATHMTNFENAGCN